jgi:succinate-acetate transporter protein
MSHSDPTRPPAPNPGPGAGYGSAPPASGPGSQPATATAGSGTHVPFSDRIADPGPLGLAAFAGTTFFLSVVNTNMLNASVTAGVLGLAFFYGGLAQLLAGMWEFAKGNTFGAVAFSSYGAFWLSYWYLVTSGLPSIKGASASDVGHAVAVYLLVWTIFTFYMFIASLRTTGAVSAVFFFLFVTFLLLCIADFADSTTITKVGGWVGIVTAAAAWYASFAAVTNFTFKRNVVPVFPLG